jgi:hypothetical protein
MRGPQVEFSATMRKIKARTSLLTRFRPPTRLTLEIQRVCRINPCWEGSDMTAVVERLSLEALATDS